MAYEPHLISPFTDSGLKDRFKPFLIGNTAFPSISDAYAWRGRVRKREGFSLLSTLPTSPVQGLKNWVNPSTLAQSLIAYSTTKSYLFNGVSNTFADITFNAAGTPFSWSNTADQFFWTTNFKGSLWSTNNINTATDGIQFWNGSPTTGWNPHQPQVDGTPNYLNAALIILPYKGRLVVLNTTEGAQNRSTNNFFPQRARWCQLGTPYLQTVAGTYVPPAPFATPGSSDNNAWRSDIPGRGGFIDADTNERIVSADIVKDTLIVFFQRSTWRLRYIGETLIPFIWERLNTQYGAESTFSNVAFDDSVLAFSRYGWIGSDTNSTVRIDEDIPDHSFSYEASNATLTGLARVQGIRDFYREMAYWTYENQLSTTGTNQIYAYDYRDKGWYIFNPQTGTSGSSTNLNIRCFGNYFVNTDNTWGSLSTATDTWGDYDGAEDTWGNLGAGQNAGFPFIVGGDNNGNVYSMFEFFNAPSNIDNTTNFNFSIKTKTFNPYLEGGLNCRLGFIDLYCTTSYGGQITVNHYVNDQQKAVFTRAVNLYPRGTFFASGVTTGLTTTITTTQPINVMTGQSVRLSSFTGPLGAALNNKTGIVTFISPNSFSVNIDTNGLAYQSGGVVYFGLFDPGLAKYTRIYLGAVAHMHQIEFTLSSDQLLDPVYGTVQFEMQAMVAYTRAEGRIRG
jgi:hypothetical protein